MTRSSEIEKALRLIIDAQLRYGGISLHLTNSAQAALALPEDSIVSANILQPNPYWLIERNQLHGEPEARWFSERRCFAQGEEDLWVADVTRAKRFKTKELAENSIKEKFTNDERYPVLPIATDHIDLTFPIPEDGKTVNAELYGLAVELADSYAWINYSDADPRYSRYLSLRESSGEPMPYKVVRDGDKVRFE